MLIVFQTNATNLISQGFLTKMNRFAMNTFNVKKYQFLIYSLFFSYIHPIIVSFGSLSLRKSFSMVVSSVYETKNHYYFHLKLFVNLFFNELIINCLNLSLRVVCAHSILFSFSSHAVIRLRL